MLPGPGADPEADWSAGSKVPEAATVAARAAPPAPPPAGEAAWSAAAEAAPAGPGGRYQIDEELGRGAMGVVYRARDTVLEREVALKELPSRLVRERSLAERFRIEARALAKLTHPGIVQVYDLVENDEGMWIAMELVSGGSLDAPLEQGSPPLGEALRLGAEMADALAHAHSQGVVHRDFKPHNVLLTPEGRPKITDFGLAKVAREGPKLTQVGAIMGSPAYMSPEQAAGGDIDHRADAYAFGATLYQMLVGRCPFEGNTASILAAHITQPAPDPGDFGVELPAALRTLLASLLAKEPADRPNDLAVVAEELRRVGATVAS
ncbi:MAG: serine/threonine-protein kinase, partial [Myxococcota bacterium]